MTEHRTPPPAEHFAEPSPRPRFIGEGPRWSIALERAGQMIGLYRPRTRALLDRAGLLPSGNFVLYDVTSQGTRATLIAQSNSYDIRTLNEVWGGRVYDRWLRSALTPGSVVIDLGANRGYFTVLASLLGASHVVAVEPHPENLRLLAANVALNGCSVDVIAAAVTPESSPSTLSLSVSRNPRLHSVKARDRDELGTIDVDAVSVTSLLAAAPPGRVALLKVDIEGAEWEVLGALEPGQLANVELIVVEADDHPGADLVDRFSLAGLSLQTDYPFFAFRR